MNSWGKLGLFAGGVLFGTVGMKILSSKDAKKAIAHTTAAVLRAKEEVMKYATGMKENMDDIYADAKVINDSRQDTDTVEVIEDEAERE